MNISIRHYYIAGLQYRCSKRDAYIFCSRIMGRGDGMTIHEASERYTIPMEVLRAYESWGLCGTVKSAMGAWQYDGTDLERLSMIMTLHDIGFESSEIETYMKLLLEKSDAKAQCLNILERKRQSILADIHFREKQLSHLDYLRYSIRKNQDTKRTI